MKLDEVTAVYQTSDMKEVNEHLAKGYRIIKIISSKKVEGCEEVVQPCYVLALGRS